MNVESLLDQIQASEVAGICRDLVRFKTVNPPGDELPAAQYVLDLLCQASFEGELVISSGPTRASVLARLKGTGEAPGLAFNGHLDVVPVGSEGWKHDPFEGVVEDSKVWGRGSADMKGGLASMLVAARLLAQSKARLRGDLVFTASAGEEVNMEGARALATHPGMRGLQAVVVAEPTNNRLGLAERGVFWPEFTTHGKTAHGSTPELGRNAIMMMVKLLSELERLDIPFKPHPVLGKFTRSINTIQGGVKTNVVPDSCVVTVDMRTVPGQDHGQLLEQMQEFAGEMERRVPDLKVSVRKVYDLPPAETSPDERVVKVFEEAAARATGKPLEPQIVRFATEAAIFVPSLGLPTIIYGPGDDALAHQPNEFIPVDRMVEAARVYLATAASLLA